MMLLLILLCWALNEETLLAERLRALSPEARAQVLAYLKGELDLQQLQHGAIARLTPLPAPRRRGPEPHVFIPDSEASIQFYGGGLNGPCEGEPPRGPDLHHFRAPGYVSILYHKIVYDPSAEAWAQKWDQEPGPDDPPRPDLGAKGKPVGMVYAGVMQRFWGHGFLMELETDPFNGFHERIELVHFVERDCPIAPGIEIPCIKSKDLYTFTFSIKDKQYQVRKAALNWQTRVQLSDFYHLNRFVWVAGTSAAELKSLEGIDAGYADGGQTVYTASRVHDWAPCGDFSFQLFHALTQKRAASWPGEGMPLLVFGRSKVTDKQRQRTHEDFESARGRPTSMDRRAGTTAVLGASQTDTALVDSEGFTQKATKQALALMQAYQEQLVLLGTAFPQSHISRFADFALRELDQSRVSYLFDLDRWDPECACYPKRDELFEKFPLWVARRILDRPDEGFTYTVATWLDIDWTPPYLSQNYRPVLDHPNALIPVLESLDRENDRQTDLLTQIVNTTEVVRDDPDPNQRSDWPQWSWPAIENPDTYWSITLTWH